METLTSSIGAAEREITRISGMLSKERMRAAAEKKELSDRIRVAEDAMHWCVCGVHCHMRVLQYPCMALRPHASPCRHSGFPTLQLTVSARAEQRASEAMLESVKSTVIAAQDELVAEKVAARSLVSHSLQQVSAIREETERACLPLHSLSLSPLSLSLSLFPPLSPSGTFTHPSSCVSISHTSPFSCCFVATVSVLSTLSLSFCWHLVQHHSLHPPAVAEHPSVCVVQGTPRRCVLK